MNYTSSMTTKLMNPVTAKSDEEVLRCVEIWEDQYKEALKMGVTPMEDVCKISILEDIVSDNMKDAEGHGTTRGCPGCSSWYRDVSLRQIRHNHKNSWKSRKPALKPAGCERIERCLQSP